MFKQLQYPDPRRSENDTSKYVVVVRENVERERE